MDFRFAFSHPVIASINYIQFYFTQIYAIVSKWSYKFLIFFFEMPNKSFDKKCNNTLVHKILCKTIYTTGHIDRLFLNVWTNESAA